MKLKSTFLAFVVALSAGLFMLVLAPRPAMAAVDPQCNKSSYFFGLPTWYKYLDVKYDKTTKSCNVNLTKMKPPNEETVDVGAAVISILLAVFEILLWIAGLVTVGFIIYGGFEFLISQGEPDRFKAARNTVINAFIGLVIVLAATAIVNLIAGVVT